LVTAARADIPSGVGREWVSRVTRRAKSLRRSANASSPTSTTPPDRGVCGWASDRSSADLPNPFGPISATTVPARGSMPTPCTTVRPSSASVRSAPVSGASVIMS